MLNFENKRNCLNCKKKIDCFKYLTEDELKEFNTNRCEISYNPGEIIFKQGAPMTHLMSFVDGLAKMYIEGLNNRNLILELIKPGDIINGPGMYTDFKHHYTIAAVTPSTACFIDVNVYKKVLNENFEFSKKSLKTANVDTLFRFKKFVSLTQKQMPGRVADALLYLYTDIFKENPFSMKISRQDLADMTALSKESVIRILKQFKDHNLIHLDHDVVEILDLKELEQISQFG
jgi:CRP/FNR family transcriptional regulator